MHLLIRTVLSLALILSGTLSASAAALVPFFRADDLDFVGTFVLALTTRNSADGLQVGNAIFSADPDGTAGAIGGANNIESWGNYFYTGSANPTDDDNLSQVMNAIEWSQENVNPINHVIIDGLTAGRQYRLQLLFQEECCAGRYTDITLDGTQIFDEFHYPTPNSPPGLAIVQDFTATGSSALVEFPYASTAGDHNATVSAVTVEALPVPEAGVLSLLGLGGFALIRRRRA